MTFYGNQNRVLLISFRFVVVFCDKCGYRRWLSCPDVSRQPSILPSRPQPCLVTKCRNRGVTPRLSEDLEKYRFLSKIPCRRWGSEVNYLALKSLNRKLELGVRSRSKPNALALQSKVPAPSNFVATTSDGQVYGAYSGRFVSNPTPPRSNDFIRALFQWQYRARRSVFTWWCLHCGFEPKPRFHPFIRWHCALQFQPPSTSAQKWAPQTGNSAQPHQFQQQHEQRRQLQLEKYSASECCFNSVGGRRTLFSQ